MLVLQVKLSDRQWRMSDCADFQSAYLDKASKCDSTATAQVRLLTTCHLTQHTNGQVLCAAVATFHLPSCHLWLNNMPALASCCAVHVLQGGANMVDHVFGSQLVQDLTCPGCCTSQTFQQWTSVTTPLIWHGQVCTTIGQSLDCLLDSEDCQMRCDKCGRYQQQEWCHWKNFTHQQLQAVFEG